METGLLFLCLLGVGYNAANAIMDLMEITVILTVRELLVMNHDRGRCCGLRGVNYVSACLVDLACYSDVGCFYLLSHCCVSVSLFSRVMRCCTTEAFLILFSCDLKLSTEAFFVSQHMCLVPKAFLFPVFCLFFSF